MANNPYQPEYGGTPELFNEYNTLVGKAVSGLGGNYTEIPEWNEWLSQHGGTPPAPVNTGSGSAVTTPQQPIDNSTTITNPVTGTGGTGGGTSVTAPITQPPLSPLQPTPVNPPPPVTPVTVEPPLSPLEPVEVSPRPVTPVEVTPPATPVTPYVPVPTPPVPEDPTKPKGYGPITPLEFGDVGKIYNPGLNPGFIQPTPFYQTYSPVQSQYYWGQHPYQPGPTFDQNLYNQVPNAPYTPFGIQQMYTPTDINQYLSQFTAGPVAPR